jgi:hypothetical protein
MSSVITIKVLGCARDASAAGAAIPVAADTGLDVCADEELAAGTFSAEEPATAVTTSAVVLASRITTLPRPVRRERRRIRTFGASGTLRGRASKGNAKVDDTVLLLDCIMASPLRAVARHSLAEAAGDHPYVVLRR